MMEVISGRVYNVRRIKNIIGSKGQSNIVYVCLLVEGPNGIYMTFLNASDISNGCRSPFEFINNWEIISEYKFEPPYEYISTTSH